MAETRTTETDCDRLTRLVAPPAAPVDAFGDWPAVEAAIGTRLPDDYKRLVETYGWGEFCDFLYLHTPFGTSRHNGIEWQRPYPPDEPEPDRERHPYPLHPAPGALLVWGTTMDADRLCWQTDGAPEHWPVVVWSRAGRYETHGTGTARFIEGWAGGSVGSELSEATEPDLAPWFNTFRPRTHRCLVLSEGPLAHPERLELLREALAPTTPRGSWRSTYDDTGQDHLATLDADWLLTYDVRDPHQIRIDFPPEDSGRVERDLFAAVHHMKCEVLEITTAAGTTLPTWNTATDEDEE
ncbi:SMI1/KNR4 family protein [Streptomyces sp. NPDC048606]|uniref:SMI1/KNR4 family protein n=1 Tax=Streptomyces sp. NPDC048606 TaxID=3154726 RepID=UPI003448826F